MMTKKIIALVVIVSSAVSRRTFRFSRRLAATISRLPSAPMAAASVGAAMPPMIEPSTASTSSRAGATPFRRRIHNAPRDKASRSACGIGGALDGSRQATTRM